MLTTLTKYLIQEVLNLHLNEQIIPPVLVKQHWTFTEKAMNARSVAQYSYLKDGYVSLIWNSRRNHSCYFLKLFEKYIIVIVSSGKIAALLEVFLIKCSSKRVNVTK